MKREKITVGWREWLRFEELPGRRIKTKIDTGARTSALHAEQIRIDDSGAGRPIVHFRFVLDDHTEDCEAPLVDRREIRSSNGAVEDRVVVSFTLQVGGSAWPVECTLTDRSDMVFPMLLGRTAMSGRILVNPGRSWLLGGNKDGPARSGQPEQSA